MFNIKGFIIMISFFSIQSFAVLMGVGSTGGGNAVVCGNKVELLDLYEARHIYHRNLPNLSGKPEEIAKSKALLLAKISLPEKVDTSLVILVNAFSAPYMWFEIGLDSMHRTIHFLAASDPMPDPDDIGETLSLPENCSIERLAAFNVQGDIFIRKPLYDRLTNLDKAALFFHEYLYKGLKESDLIINEEETVHTSEHIRYVTGLFFSDEVLSQRFINFPDSDEKVAICTTSDGEFRSFLYPDRNSTIDKVEYRQEFFVVDGRFSYLANNRNVGDIPVKYEFLYSRTCKFLTTGEPWSSN